jgi:hypothetical protein
MYVLNSGILKLRFSRQLLTELETEPLSELEDLLNLGQQVSDLRLIQSPCGTELTKIQHCTGTDRC